MKILTGNSNRSLAEAMSAFLDLPLTKARVRRFSDMEIFVEIDENVRGEDVFLIQSTSYPANDNVMELLIAMDALKRGSARRITAVIPYYGYARQDRKSGPRTPISATLVANLITAAGADVFDADGNRVERPVRETALSGAAIGKGGHPHFMLKEIYEQPQVIGDTLRAFINPATRAITLPDLPFDPAAASRITLIACGTSFYAALVAKYWFERIAKVPVEVDIASEFRYRAAPMAAGGLTLVISQSG